MRNVQNPEFGVEEELNVFLTLFLKLLVIMACDAIELWMVLMFTSKIYWYWGQFQKSQSQIWSLVL